MPAIVTRAARATATGVLPNRDELVELEARTLLDELRQHREARAAACA